MKNEVVKIDPKEFGLEESNVATIEQAFSPKIAERDGYAVIYEQLITKELTPETCKQARELRLKLVKTRTGIADIHKTQKAYFLAAGKFCDAWKNKETLPVEQMEEKLAGIENHFENLEKERIAKLEEARKIELLQFTEILPVGLGSMDEAVYQNYLIGAKAAFESKKEAERKAEEERIAKEKSEKEEQERIKAENEKLKAENEAKEKQLQEERLKAQEEAAKEAEKQSEILAKQQAEAKRIQDEKDAENAKLLAELKAKEEAEAKAKKEAEEAEAKAKKEAEEAAKAPIKNQLSNWVDYFVIESAPIDNETSKLIKEKFSAFKTWAKSEINKL